MKTLTLASLVSLALVASAHAGTCPVNQTAGMDGTAFSTAITDAVTSMYKQSGCQAAAALEDSCLQGSTIDSDPTDQVVALCSAEFAKNPDDVARFAIEKKRCLAQDGKYQGTMGISIRDACGMEASRVIARQYSCENTAENIAQTNLNFIANQLVSGQNSDVGDAKFVTSEAIKLDATLKETDYVYSVAGEIYKGSYAIQVVTDSNCILKSIKLTPSL